LRGIRLFCVSPPNGIAVPTMDDSPRPSMGYPADCAAGEVCCPVIFLKIYSASGPRFYAKTGGFFWENTRMLRKSCA
jgi:hypothetical protein